MTPTFPFRARRLVRFADCDPAGIVYFPRYYDFFHGALEDWFTGALGIDYWAMLRERQLGLPAVRTECDYRRPARMGDRLEIAVLIERLGGSSITTRYEAYGAGELRAEARVVQVTMPLGTTRPVAIPPWLRAAVEAYRDNCERAGRSV